MRILILLLILFFFSTFVYADDTLKFPLNVRTDQEKYEYVMNVKHAIRVERNNIKQKHIRGEITDREWAIYEQQLEMKRGHVYHDEYQYRKKLEQSQKYQVDLDDLTVAELPTL